MNGSQDSALAAAIRDEATTRANGLSALANRASTLESSVNTTSGLVKNATFAMNGGGADGALPAFWNVWADEAGTRRRWVTGRESPSGFNDICQAGQSQGILQQFQASAGYYVIEATVEIWDGNLAGAGVLVYGLDTLGNLVTGYSQALLDFAVEPPIGSTNIPGFLLKAEGGSTSSTRRYSKLVNLCADDPYVAQRLATIRVYAMSNWNGFGHGLPYKYFYWAKCNIRPATSAEINGDKALPLANSAIARITAEETTRADQYSALANRASTLEASSGTARTDINNLNQYNLDRYNETVAARARISNVETVTSNGTFAAASTVNSLSSSVGSLNSTVSTQAGTIANLQGRTSAYWSVQAVAGNNRAQIALKADANGGAGVDIVGDVRITGADGRGSNYITPSGMTTYDANGVLRFRCGLW